MCTYGLQGLTKQWFAGESYACQRSFHCLILLWNQSIIGRFTKLPRYSGSVISFCQLSRSCISPVAQFGEHHGGAGGCLASGDSAGIRGGATDGGGELGTLVAQPLASSIGASIASVSSRSFFLGMGSCLLLRLGASLFFLSGAVFADHLGQTVAAVTFC